jgi:hypothetical protein
MADTENPASNPDNAAGEADQNNEVDEVNQDDKANQGAPDNAQGNPPPPPPPPATPVPPPNRNPNPQPRRWPKRIVTTVAVVVLILIVIASIPDLKAQLFSHFTSTVACGDVSPPPTPKPSATPSSKPSTTPAAKSPAKPKPPATLPGTATLTAKLLPTQRGEVDFGRALTERTLTVYLSLSNAPKTGTTFHSRTNQFLRSDGGSLNRSDIITTVTSDGPTLILTTCFLRDKTASLGDPGSYSGSVTIDDYRLKAAITVPMTVTMQYSNGVFLLWLYFAAVIPGAWCVWVLRSNRQGTQSALSRDFFAWATSVNGLVALVSGSIAAFAVYTGVYLRDPTWGYSGLQPLTLYGGMFSAYVTTSGLASLTGQKTPADPNAPGGT